MKIEDKHRHLSALLDSHRSYRQNCLNLIASENVPSPFVDSHLVEELNQRYGNYTGIDLTERFYQGNKFIVEIESYAHQLAKDLFRANFVDLRPLSGNIAGIATTFALCRPGDTVLEVGNGHQYANKLASSGLKVDLKSVSIPWDDARSNINLPATIELIKEHRPRVVNIGSGIFLFPQPTSELKQAMIEVNPDSYLVYDAAHVLGLIAGGQFQSPLEEGTDVIISSTHKTLAGPQGGMVLTNDRLIAERIGPAIAPLLESNHHLSRLPALAATFLEWNEFGTEHATAIVKNAKALGQALADRGLALVGSDLGYTESHTLIPMVSQFGPAKALADQLEACHIITGAVGADRLRIGVQEVTRRGMDEADAPLVADCIVDALKGDDPETVKQRVIDLVKRLDQFRFTITPES
ncbi:glycine hydroxymethyltransferase [Candidatus Poribacteria bacterium]|nr:glycine hydroxymethyltransferase [Candidatus Poribacteria bacterium]